ncbi:MAG TPA: M1 family aminopeptidase [Thermoanaerobaculia bacterium]
MIRKLLRILLALAVIVAVAGAVYFALAAWRSRRDARERAESPQGRLPPDVRPVAYDLELRIDPRRDRFEGKAAIRLDVTRPTDVIWLHGQDVDPTSAAVVTADGVRRDADYREMGRSGVVRLRPAAPLAAGPATLEISYTAPLGSRLAGAYRVDVGEQSYVFTQFQATDARRAFPCFDEPAFKTPFDVALVVPRGVHGLANAPEISREDAGEGFQRLRFATTPPLPTYLVAFAVGPFDVVEWEAVPPNAVRPHPVPLRGIAAAGQGGKLGYALSQTAAILGLLEEYFGSPYPFAKLDLVAVPDFAAGAMENPGLVTYREEILLVGDDASAEVRREYGLIHAHELAHQWHGNLVTMPWWDDVWLNESFATWMQERIAEAWAPELELGGERVRSAHGVMRSDGYVSARQVRQPIASPHDVASAFDGITYEKGAAVIRMFESFLGEEAFRAGVRAHLERFARGHATTDDFLESVATASAAAGDAPSGDAFVAAFRSFVEQPGVPLLRTEWSCDGGVVEIRLAQSRYLPVGSQGSPDALWRIPVCVKSLAGAGPATECLLMTEPAATLRREGSPCPSAVMPNAGAEGYYRWSLPRDGWTALLASLDRLSEEEIYSVLDNLEAELRAGRVDVGFFFDAVRPVVALDAWDLVMAPIDELKFIANYLVPEDRRPRMRAFMEALYLPRYRELGLTADTDLDRQDPVSTALLRSRLVAFLALDARSSEVRDDLLGPGKDFIGFGGDGALHAEAIDPDLATPALTVALEELGEPFYEALREHVQGSDDADFRRRALLALGQVTDPELSREARSLVLSFSLRLGEKAYVMVGQMRQPENQERLYEWLKRYYGVLAAILPDAYVSRTPMVASSFCDRELLADVRAFFEPRMREVHGGPRSLENVLERIEVCAALVASQPDFEVPRI